MYITRSRVAASLGGTPSRGQGATLRALIAAAWMLNSANAAPAQDILRAAAQANSNVGAAVPAATLALPSVVDETGSASAQSPEPSESTQSNMANNPLEPSVMFTLQNYYAPSLHGVEDRDANVLLLRGLMPSMAFGQPQLIRATLPISTIPTATDRHSTGVGDLLLMDLLMYRVKGGSVGVGPVAVLPTGNRVHGSQKWQAGASAVAAFPYSWGLLGVINIYQHSIAGKEDRDDVRQLTVQPIIFFNLPKRFYLRSTGVLNFDLEHGTHYLPVGLGGGRVWSLSKKLKLNLYAEPQYTIAHKGVGAPKWQIFAGINLQYLVK